MFLMSKLDGECNYNFQRDMERIKGEWMERNEGMKKVNIRWEETVSDGIKVEGNYEGEAKDDKPHGLGKWKAKDRFNRDLAIEGEWKDGRLKGKVVGHWIWGHEEYEVKEGIKNGKFIQYNHDGNRY